MHILYTPLDTATIWCIMEVSIFSVPLFFNLFKKNWRILLIKCENIITVKRCQITSLSPSITFLSSHLHVMADMHIINHLAK